MLCTLDALKDYLNILDDSQDEKLSSIIAMTSARIEGFLGYPLKRRENVEVRAVNNDQLLVLDYQPIQSVESVKIGGVEVEDYRLIPRYSNIGILYRGQGWCGPYYTRGMTYDAVAGAYDIEVAYTSGYYLPTDEEYTEGAEDSLPPIIQAAAIYACAEAYDDMTEGVATVKSHSEGGISTTYADDLTSQMSGGGIGTKAGAMLMPYRRGAVV